VDPPMNCDPFSDSFLELLEGEQVFQGALSPFCRHLMNVEADRRVGNMMRSSPAV
jgi:hypothetical protein